MTSTAIRTTEVDGIAALVDPAMSKSWFHREVHAPGIGRAQKNPDSAKVRTAEPS